MKNHNKYLAVDCTGDRPRYLHICGTCLTSNQFWAWAGTIDQFDKITQENEWDNLKPLPVDKLRK